MPEVGTYLLTNTGFSVGETPVISLQKDGALTDLLPLGKTLSLTFDLSQRYCVGWRDITAGGCFSCPDNNLVDSKYEQCPACQKRTGFNPAFYHATSVSEQQEARNKEPHILYLARFGTGIVKVGISYAKRGNSRLLEQGARDALILDTFPTAHIARQYEAKIAAMPGIAETVQLQKKIHALSKPYNHVTGSKELEITRKIIEDSIGAQFAGNSVMSLDALYFPGATPDLSSAFDCTPQHTISGNVIGTLGSLLFCEYDDTPVFLPLKKLVGYMTALSYDETSLDLPARQISLF